MLEGQRVLHGVIGIGLVFLSCGLVAADPTLQPEPQQPVVTQPAPPPQPQQPGSTATPQAPAQPGDEVVCKQVDPPAGSRIGRKRVCRTVADWRRLHDGARATVDTLQGRSRTDNPPGG